MTDKSLLSPAGADSNPGITSALPLWLRLPKARTRCPFTGLSRGTMIELVLPGPANGYRPPVKSAQIKKRNAQRGVRLVSGPSLSEYIDNLAAQQASEAISSAAGAGKVMP